MFQNLSVIKVVFSEEIYVPQPKFESVSMLSALYCVTKIHQLLLRENMHKHYFGQTLKLQSAVVTVNLRSRSLESKVLFSVSKQCIYACLVQKNTLVKRKSSKKAEFSVF